MNMAVAEAEAAVESFLRHIDTRTTADVAICPPYLAIGVVGEVLRGSRVALGAQDVFWAEKGAFTGRISAKMLVDVGVSTCIVGHSETRGRFGKLEVPESTIGYFAETDETINLKIKALLYASIAPILCVGETLAEREAGSTDAVIAEQIVGALVGLDPSELGPLSIAYEPVWAIGTGQTCDSAEANRVCGVVRAEVAKLCGDDLAQSMRILYGGSVKSSNAYELFHQSDIDGGLVGGASLDPEEFSRIVMSG